MKQAQRGSAVEAGQRAESPGKEQSIQGPDGHGTSNGLDRRDEQRVSGQQSGQASERVPEPAGKASNSAVLEQDDFGGIGTPFDDEKRP